MQRERVMSKKKKENQCWYDFSLRLVCSNLDDWDQYSASFFYADYLMAAFFTIQSTFLFKQILFSDVDLCTEIVRNLYYCLNVKICSSQNIVFSDQGYKN